MSWNIHPRTVKATRGHVQRFEVCERGALRRDSTRELVVVQVDEFERRRHLLRQRSCAREKTEVIRDLWRDGTARIQHC